jgi:LPS export ABC transporter protein LptC
MMPLRSWLSLGILIAVLFGILNLLERLENQAKAERKVRLPPIDYTFNAVRYSALDSKGRMRLEVSSTRMVHLRDARTLTMETPVVTRFGGDSAGIAQTLSAKQAIVHAEGERVELSGGVAIDSAEGASATQLRTDQLTLLPPEKRAFTEGEVQIQQASATLQGRGLIADFAAQTLELQHDVRSQILPR